MLAILLALPSRTGVDVSTAVGESTWTCLQSPGGQGPIEYAVVRVYRSSGTVDPNAAATIKAARAAGIANVDGYVFPCVTCATAPGVWGGMSGVRPPIMPVSRLASSKRRRNATPMPATDKVQATYPQRRSARGQAAFGDVQPYGSRR